MLKGHPGFRGEEAPHKHQTENPWCDSTLGLNITPKKQHKGRVLEEDEA